MEVEQPPDLAQHVEVAEPLDVDPGGERRIGEQLRDLRRRSTSGARPGAPRRTTSRGASAPARPRARRARPASSRPAACGACAAFPRRRAWWDRSCARQHIPRRAGRAMPCSACHVEPRRSCAHRSRARDPHHLLREPDRRAGAPPARAHGGRKGAPNKLARAGRAPGARRDRRARPRAARMDDIPADAARGDAFALIEVFYDDASEPSISVPCLDFFGLPHGRPAPYASALSAAQEGRGFNCWLPLPFWRRIRIELTNGSKRRFPFYYQVAYTLGPEPARTACCTPASGARTRPAAPGFRDRRRAARARAASSAATSASASCRSPTSPGTARAR